MSGPSGAADIILAADHGSHFSGLTNFPDFSSIFHSFSVFFKVIFLFKVWHLIYRIFTITDSD